MADFIYSDATFMCEHGGTITVTPSKRDVQVERKNGRTKMVISNKIDTGGAYLIRIADLDSAIITGCTHMEGGIPNPCIKVLTTSEDTLPNINNGTLLIGSDPIAGQMETVGARTLGADLVPRGKVKYIPKIDDMTKSVTTSANRVNIKSFANKEQLDKVKETKVVGEFIGRYYGMTPPTGGEVDTPEEIKNLIEALIGINYVVNDHGENYNSEISHHILTFIVNYNKLPDNKKLELASEPNGTKTKDNLTQRINDKGYAYVDYRINQAIKEQKKHLKPFDIDEEKLKKAEKEILEFYVPLNTCKGIYGSSNKDPWCSYCIEHTKIDLATGKVKNLVKENDLECYNAKAISHSGVTVSVGVDLGKKTEQEMNNTIRRGLKIRRPSVNIVDMKAKIEPYYGKVGDEAIKKLRDDNGYKVDLVKRKVTRENGATNKTITQDESKMLKTALLIESKRRTMNTYRKYKVETVNDNKQLKDGFLLLTMLNKELKTALLMYHYVIGYTMNFYFHDGDNFEFSPERFEEFGVSLCITKAKKVTINGKPDVLINPSGLSYDRRDIMANLLYNGIIEQWKHLKIGSDVVQYSPTALLEYKDEKKSYTDSNNKEIIIIKVDK